MFKFLTDTFSAFKKDLEMFKIVHPEPSIFKYLYYPDIRTVFIFRLSTFFICYKFSKPLAYFLTLLNDFIAGVWIGPNVNIKSGLFLGHSRGLVINPTTKIGHNCSIMQKVAIGGPNVTIGDNVEINTGASIISNVRGNAKLKIGNNVIIGAGAVVLNDVPDCSIVAGVPAKVVKSISPDQNWVVFRMNRNSQNCYKQLDQ